MPVSRTKPRTFKVIPQATLDDPRLLSNPVAFTVLGYMLGREDGFTFSARRIAMSTGMGRHRVEKAVRDLSEYGYIITTRQQNAAGHWASTVIAYDRAVPNRTPGNGPNRNPGNRAPGNQAPGNGGSLPSKDTKQGHLVEELRSSLETSAASAARGPKDMATGALPDDGEYVEPLRSKRVKPVAEAEGAAAGALPDDRRAGEKETSARDRRDRKNKEITRWTGVDLAKELRDEAMLRWPMTGRAEIPAHIAGKQFKEVLIDKGWEPDLVFHALQVFLADESLHGQRNVPVWRTFLSQREAVRERAEALRRSSRQQASEPTREVYVSDEDKRAMRGLSAFERSVYKEDLAKKQGII